MLPLPWRGGRVLEPGIRTGGFFTGRIEPTADNPQEYSDSIVLRDRARGDVCKARGAG
ncbi:conserved hypothetical protein [Mesorhizobium prunaredense]|uniref:Uncharacterized protein n=1 Tax=Mesorhizobium prunaredense TaxID=1631249 RepID=A0A1R3V4J7_9HYPH|nr:conserved hypothetical protein [Mesorhizobium prunaredense]